MDVGIGVINPQTKSIDIILYSCKDCAEKE